MEVVETVRGEEREGDYRYDERQEGPTAAPPRVAEGEEEGGRRNHDEARIADEGPSERNRIAGREDLENIRKKGPKVGEETPRERLVRTPPRPSPNREGDGSDQGGRYCREDEIHVVLGYFIHIFFSLVPLRFILVRNRYAFKWNRADALIFPRYSRIIGTLYSSCAEWSYLL